MPNHHNKRRGPGSYTSRACTPCRRRKRKCDGVKPVCGLCVTRKGECVWDSKEIEKNSSNHLMESLQNRIQVVEQENSLLRDRLARCTCLSSRTLTTIGDTDLDETSSQSSCGSQDVEELRLSTKRLILEQDNLTLYGPTSAFGLDPTEDPNAMSSRSQPKEMQGTYVLYAENDGIDWDRYLPETALTRNEHDRLLEILFKFFSSWSMIIVPELFLQDMYCALCSPQPVTVEHYSPMLHNATLSFLCSFSDDPAIKDVKTRTLLMSKAKSLLDSECQKPSISTAHALHTIGSFHSTCSEQTLGYLYFGMSGRVCQTLGLGNNCSGWVESGRMSKEVALHRNWAYWSLFVTDVYWSLYVGRDFCLPDPDPDIKEGRILLPIVDQGMDDRPWRWQEPNFPEQPARITSTFLATCELMRIGRRIIHLVNSGFRNHRLLTEVDLQLNAWKDNLSPELDITPSSRMYALPHRLVLHIAYWWLLSLLHRPFYIKRPRRSNPESVQIDHVKICDRAAHNIISLISTYDALYSVRYIPSLAVQAMFSMGSIFVLCAVRTLSGNGVSDKPLSESLSQAKECIALLDKSSVCFENCRSMKRILENMIRMWVAPRVTPRTKEVYFLAENNAIPLSEVPNSDLADAVPIVSDVAPGHIPRPLETDYPLSFQDQTNAYSYFSSGTSMLSNHNLPDQPFMTITGDLLPHPLQPGFSMIDPTELLVDTNTGLSAQNLMDELSLFWMS